MGVATRLCVTVALLPFLLSAFFWGSWRNPWQHYKRHQATGKSWTLLHDRMCSRPLQVPEGVTEGPLAICGDLIPRPAEALVLQHELLRLSQEAQGRGGVGVLAVRILESDKLDCPRKGGECQYEVELAFGNTSCVVEAKYNIPPKVSTWHSVAIVFDVKSHSTSMILKVRDKGPPESQIGVWTVHTHQANPRVGRGPKDPRFGQHGQLFVDVVFAGQWNSPLRADPPLEAKGVEHEFGKFGDATHIRADPENGTNILWQGDSRVAQSAIVQVVEPAVPTDSHGHYVPVGNSTAECREACNSGVGCYYMQNGHGRLGNVLQELAHIWYYLHATRYSKGIEYNPGYSIRLFEFPEYACLDKLGEFDSPVYKPQLSPECPKYPQFGNEYGKMCPSTSRMKYIEVIRRFIVPHLARPLRTCLETQRKVDEDRLLTIHLRGEDIFGGHVASKDYENEQWQHHGNPARVAFQSPCGFMQKILSTKDFSRVLIVSSQDLMNPCVKWLSDKRSNLTNAQGQVVEWELQTGNLLEDSCALMKARHLLLSESSLSHNLVMYAAAAQPDVHRHVYALKYQLNWMLGCGTPNITMNIWNRSPDPISSARPTGIAPLVEWLKNIGPEMFNLGRTC